MTTIRVVYNYMTETVSLAFEGGVCTVHPHGRETAHAVIPLCEDASAFERQGVELSIPRLDQRIRIWEAEGRIRFSRDGRWQPDAEVVPAFDEAGGGRGLIVGATGAFWFKKVNI
jgi:hypothetical protein